MLCTNARRNLKIAQALGQKGCKTCIILSSQPEQLPARCSRKMRRALSDASARPQQSRTAGPMARAERRLYGADHRGKKLAFISQSAAVSNTILDWAQQREMGFSYFIATNVLWILMSMTCWTFWPAAAGQAPFCAVPRASQRRAPLCLRRAQRPHGSKPITVIKSGRSPAAQEAVHANSGWTRHGMRPFALVCCGCRIPRQAVLCGGNPSATCARCW